jgi:hypothetical protein
MASSSSSGSRGDDGVDIDAVPTALAARLGPEATSGLLHVLDLAHGEWSDDVMSVAGERYGRRLAEEGSSLRVQIAQTEGALRTEIAQSEGRLRSEIGQLEVNFRRELGRVETGLRQDFSQMEIRVLREVGNSRFELLKWSFLFWIGQVVTMSAIVAAMLRIIR